MNHRFVSFGGYGAVFHSQLGCYRFLISTVCSLPSFYAATVKFYYFLLESKILILIFKSLHSSYEIFTFNLSDPKLWMFTPEILFTPQIAVYLGALKAKLLWSFQG